VEEFDMVASTLALLSKEKQARHAYSQRLDQMRSWNLLERRAEESERRLKEERRLLEESERRADESELRAEESEFRSKEDRRLLEESERRLKAERKRTLIMIKLLQKQGQPLFEVAQQLGMTVDEVQRLMEESSGGV